MSDNTAHEITFYILVSVNTSEDGELAYTDEVIFECETKLTAEHLDQREK